MEFVKKCFIRELNSGNLRFFVYWQLIWAFLFYGIHNSAIVFEHIENPRPPWVPIFFLGLAGLALLAFYIRNLTPKAGLFLFTLARTPTYIFLVLILYGMGLMTLDSV